MRKTSENVADEYIHLCGKLNYDQTDVSRKAVRQHNKAMMALRQLAEEIAKEHPDAEAVFSQLMDNSEPYVRLSSAAQALRMNLCTEKAEAVLEQISTMEGMKSFDAKIVLRIWRGELPGNHL